MIKATLWRKRHSQDTNPVKEEVSLPEEIIDDALFSDFGKTVTQMFDELAKEMKVLFVSPGGEMFTLEVKAIARIERHEPVGV